MVPNIHSIALKISETVKNWKSVGVDFQPCEARRQSAFPIKPHGSRPRQGDSSSFLLDLFDSYCMSFLSGHNVVQLFHLPDRLYLRLQNPKSGLWYK